MKRLFLGIRRKIIHFLSLDLMDERYQVLAANYVFLMFYTTLETVFVNTLLYQISPEISVVIRYRAVVYLSSAVTMHLAAWMAQKKDPVFVMRLGALFYLLMYVTLFIGISHMAAIKYLAAFLTGLGYSFYWSAHNILVTHYTTRGNRDAGIAVLSIIQGALTLFCPLISGLVISLTPGFAGYRVMFALGMLAVVLQMRVHRKLAPVTQTRHESQVRLAFRLLWKKATYKLMLVYEMIRGVRDGTFAFILNAVLFELITDELLIGVNTFLTGALAITGAWVYGRYVTAKSRVRYTVLATTALLLFCGLAYRFPGAPMIILFTVVNAFFQLFLINSCCNMTYDLLGQNENTRKCMGETLAIREGAITLGRIGGLALVLAFPAGDVTGYIEAMFILTLTQYLLALFMKLTQMILDRKSKTGA